MCASGRYNESQTRGERVPTAGGGQRGYDERQAGQQSLLLHVAVQLGLQGVKAKVHFPQFLLNHGRDNPHYESCCGNTRDVREPDV